MTDAPAPLTPPDCDLRGYGFMPLYGDRLFASATWISAKPEGKVAALRLWWHSFAKEVPAASLPDDDVLLSEYAGYGVAVSAWRKVKAQALRGWIKCSDGRLYHATVAEIAIEAFAGRRDKSSDKDRKQREREDRSRMFDDLSGVGITPPWNVTTTELRALHKANVTQTCHAKPVTGHAQTCHNVTAREGEGQRERQGTALRRPVQPEPPRDGKPTWQIVADAVSHPWLDPNKHQRLVTKGGIVRGWIEAGADLDLDVIPTVKQLLAELAPHDAPVTTWDFFTKAIRRNTAARLAAEQPQPKIEPENRDATRNHDHVRAPAPGPQPRGAAGAVARDRALRARQRQAGGQGDQGADEPERRAGGDHGAAPASPP